MMVINAGFDGTGTGALAAALDRLGLGPCLDLAAWQARPTHLPAWEEAANGGAVDWNAVLAGHPSVSGWPCCHFWRELAAGWPGARVILTTREPQAWYRSASATVFASLREPPKGSSAAAWQLLRKIILHQTFGGNTDDPALAVETLRMHEREVEQAIPSERLLVFEVSRGWEPLCRFLEVTAPDEPFPADDGTA